MVFAAFTWIPFAFLFFKNPNSTRWFAKYLSFGVLKILGIRMQREGWENAIPDQSCVYMSNHQSGLDVLTLCHLDTPRTVTVGKVEMLWIPILGWIYWAGGNVLVNRSRTQQAKAALEKVAETIKEKNLSIYIMPEGTRNRGKGILPFKKGGFHLALTAGIPIVLVVCAPLYPLISFKEKRITGGVLRFKILPAISVEPYRNQSDRKKALEDLMNLCHLEMLKTYEELSR